ncbi:MAG: F0F1 ATP synthase subunit delta [Promicromonosporaceae bacterium]|nr:F0F1 ATP synthase subunit delta [Promicromonosporaceae bacterium]
MSQLQLHGASRKALAAASARWVALLTAEVKGRHAATRALELSDQMFALSDALISSLALRRFLVDASSTDEAKRELLSQLFKDKVEPEVYSEMLQIVDSKWLNDEDLAAAVEQLGVQAVMAAARAERSGAIIESQLLQLVAALRTNPEAISFLMNSGRPIESRVKMITSVLRAGEADPVTIALVKRAIASPGAGRFLAKVAQAAEDLAGAREVTIAQVTSAVELTPAQIKRLEKILTVRFGKEIAAFVRVDPSLIGGLRIVVEGAVFDDSVSARLSAVGRYMTRSGKELANV